MKVSKSRKVGSAFGCFTFNFYTLSLLPTSIVFYFAFLGFNFATPAIEEFEELKHRPPTTVLQDLDAHWGWTVRELSGTGGSAFIALGPNGSSACALVLTGVCHVPRPHGSSHSGVWFPSRPLSGDETLSSIATDEDVCGFRDQLPRPGFGNGDVHTIASKQAKVGYFVDLAEVHRYEEIDVNPQTGAVMSADVAEIRVGVVAPQDGHLGHFVEAVGGLAEWVSSMDSALRSTSGRRFFGSPLMLFFPLDVFLSDWTTGVAQLLFGNRVEVRGAWLERKPTCFSEVFFPLNTMHSFESADAFRNRAANMAALQVAHREGGFSTLPADEVQVTVVRRMGQRNVSNILEVVEAVRNAFPDHPVRVLRFDRMSFPRQVAAMQRSPFVLTMHGATMSNVIFMRPGSTVLELFPYKFSYHAYRRIAERFGVRHLAWTNTRRENARHVDDCLALGGWEDWPEHKCHVTADCRFCVRDHAITHVHIGELSALLKEASNDVRRWREALPKDLEEALDFR